MFYLCLCVFLQKVNFPTDELTDLHPIINGSRMFELFFYRVHLEFFEIITNSPVRQICSKVGDNHIKCKKFNLSSNIYEIIFIFYSLPCHLLGGSSPKYHHTNTHDGNGTKNGKMDEEVVVLFLVPFFSHSRSDC